MSSSADKSDPTPRELAELSALADGTLDPSRRAEVESRIAASPQLSELYERERRVVAILHEARATDRAPARLRARIEVERRSKGALSRRQGGYAGALATALAAVVVALVLALPGGTRVGPSLAQAAALATRGPTHPAPAPDRSNPQKLGQDVEEVYFPNWLPHFHWKAVGMRTDRIKGREAVTVYYQWHQQRVAYTIVGQPALTQPRARVTWENGTELRTLSLGGRLIVTWRRANHTCMLSGAGVSPSQLWMMASYKELGLSE